MEEILAHALYQIQTQLNDKKNPLLKRAEIIKRITKEAIEYYENNIKKEKEK